MDPMNMTQNRSMNPIACIYLYINFASVTEDKGEADAFNKMHVLDYVLVPTLSTRMYMQLL